MKKLIVMFVLLALVGCGGDKPINDETRPEMKQVPSHDFLPNPDAADEVPAEGPDVESIRISKLGFETAKAFAIAILNYSASVTEGPEKNLLSPSAHSAFVLRIQEHESRRDLR